MKRIALALVVGLGLLAAGTEARAQESLSPGMPRDASVPSGGEVTYRFTSGTAGPYTFETSGSMDTVVAVFDASTGVFLGENDDRGEGDFTSRLPISLSAGQSVDVHLRGFLYAGGTCRISVRSGGEAAAVVNGGSLSLGTRASATLTAGGRACFRFTASEAGGYTFRVTGAGRLDTVMRVYDGHGRFLFQADDCLPQRDLNPTSAVDLAAGEMAQVVLWEYVGQDSQPAGGSLSIVVERGPQATTVGLVESVDGDIPPQGFARFHFTASEPGLYAFETGGGTDTILTMNSLEMENHNDDVGGTLNSRLTADLAAGQEVYLTVGTYDGQGGHFTLTATLVPEEVLELDRNVDAEVPEGGYVRYAFHPATPGTYTVTTTGETDTVLTVVDSENNVVAENDDYGEGLCSQVTFTLQSGQEVDIVVTTYNGRGGAYGIMATAGEGSAPQQPTGFPIGEPLAELPAGTLDIDGAAIQLADFRGSVLLVDFWATWCPPCRAEMPNVIAMYSDLHERGFEIVGISLDNNMNALRRFLTEQAPGGMTWRQICDLGGWDSQYANQYEVSSIPHTILLDRSGNVRAIDLRGSELRSAVELLLAEPGK